MNQCWGALKQNYHNKQNKQPCFRLKLKGHNKIDSSLAGLHWRRCVVTSSAAPHAMNGAHTPFLSGNAEKQSAPWKKHCCTAPDMLLVHQKELTPCLHLHKRAGSCLMPNGHVHWYRNNVLAASRSEKEPNYIIHSPFSGIEDSIYYFGNSQHHSCRWSHVKGAEQRQQKNNWILRTQGSSL